MKLLAFTFTFLICISACWSQQLELVIPTGHTRQVQDIVISKDTLFMASIQNDNEIVLWDFSSGKQLRSLRYHSARVNDIEVFAGKLWSASDDGKVMGWDFEEHKVVVELTHGAGVKSLRTGNTTLLTIGKKGDIKRWDFTGRAVQQEINLKQSVTAVSNVLNGWVMISMSDGSVNVLSLNNLETVKTLNPALEVSALAMSAGYFHVADISGTVVTYSFENDQEVNRQKVLATRVYAMQPSSTGLWVSGRSAETSLAILGLTDFSVTKPDLTLVQQTLLAQNGIRALLVDEENDLTIVPDGDNSLKAYQLSSQKLKKEFKGLASEVEDFALSNDERWLAVASNQDKIKLYDLQSARISKSLAGHVGGVTSLSFHPTDSLLASVGNDNKLRIWNVASGRNTHTFDVRGAYRSTPIQFDRTGQYIIRKADNKFFELFKLDKSRSKKLSVENGIRYKFAQNGEKLLFQTRDGITIYNSVTLKEERAYPLKGIKYFDVGGNTIVVSGNFGIRVFNLNFSDKGQIADAKGIDRIYLHPNEKLAFGTVNSVKKGTTSRDYKIKVFDLEKGEFVKEIDAHQGFVAKIGFLKEGKFILTGASDGQIQIMRFDDFETPIGSIVSLGEDDWVAITPQGIYDATTDAFNAMHYVKGKEKIALDQLKDLYFEPRLVPRLLENIQDPLPERKALNELAPHPEINITHPNMNDGVLGMDLSDKGGGVGRIMILINGKEVVRDTGDGRDASGGNVEFNYSIAGHPFLKPNAVNKISVKAYNSNGTLAAPEENLFYFDSNSEKTPGNQPRLFALVAGSGDYPGRSLDLNYAVKDAIDFSNALQASGENLFGVEKTKIQLLHTEYADTSQWPTKYNIAKALEEFSKQVTARDYLLLYFSGHGMNFGEEQEDFYYLTPFATDEIEDENVRENAMVSSAELTEMINEIPALKQVLIFDACHSGKLVSEIGKTSSTLTSGQVKALETMKDRTGLYVIAGSEADAVSYEASLFEQGLLTYSLLFGMKGAALNSVGEVDIIDLLQFVSRKLPELASEIGGVQLPEVRIPAGAESFSIGQLTPEDRDNIQLAGSKPVFIHSGFQEESQFYDMIQLGHLVDDLLIAESTKNNAPISFLDKKQFGSAYQVRGRYHSEGELWKAQIRIFQDNKQITSFGAQAVNAEELADKIAIQTLSSIGQ